MRKIITLLSTLVLVSLLLVACGGEETSTAAPATQTPQATEEPTQEATEEPLGTETVTPGEGTGTPGAGIPVTGEEDPSRISNQLDYDVWNQNGEQIGEVNDMILDTGNGNVAYVIVGTGGFLEIGERDILVPWDLLMLSTEGGDATGGDQFAFILQTDQEVFENAPDVDINTVLPQLCGPAGDWDADIRTYWESGGTTGGTGTDATAQPAGTTQPAGTAQPDATATPGTTTTVQPGATTQPGTGGTATGELQGVILASDVLGSSITVGVAGGVGTQGEAQATGTPVAPAATADPNATGTPGAGTGTDTQGEIMSATVEDIIVDIDTGDVQYVVITGTFDEGERWIPIPLTQFGCDAANGTFVLNVDQATLQAAPSFVDGQFPDMTVEGWDTEFSTFWQDGGGAGGAEATATP